MYIHTTYIYIYIERERGREIYTYNIYIYIYIYRKREIETENVFTLAGARGSPTRGSTLVSTLDMDGRR